MISLLFTNALALDCNGLDQAVCDSVNELAASVNQQRPGTIVESGGKARFRTSSIYDQLLAVRDEAVDSGCDEFLGWSAGLYDASPKVKSFAGSSARPGEVAGPVGGTIVSFSRRFTGTLTDAGADMPFGTVVSSYSKRQVVADFDRDGFVAGNFMQISGRTGVFVALYGECTPTATVEDLDDWFTGDLSFDVYPVVSATSSTAGTDLRNATGLIEGPIAGFDNTYPYEREPGGGAGEVWVTRATCFPCDYYDQFEVPVLTFDLGQNRDLEELAVWNYSETNSNDAWVFEVRFATEADGPTGFGNSIGFTPEFTLPIDDAVSRQLFGFDRNVTARYVELTITDNQFDVSALPGGDRVGLGEVAFPIP